MPRLRPLPDPETPHAPDPRAAPRRDARYKLIRPSVCKQGPHGVFAPELEERFFDLQLDPLECDDLLLAGPLPPGSPEGAAYDALAAELDGVPRPLF